MFNQTIDQLTEYPFDRLRTLLDGVKPPSNLAPIIMSLGEPQHKPPLFLSDIIGKHSGEWKNYPPVNGTPDLLEAIVDWLKNRYNLPDSLIQPTKHVIAVNGSKEALYMIGDLCIPRSNSGRQPTVLIPNPFYQVYVGAAILRGAQPIYLSATKSSGFFPDFDSLEPEVLARCSLVYLCTPANPQGKVADIEYLKKAVELAQRYDFVLAVDECYAEIYNDFPPPGILQACNEVGSKLKNVLAFHSLSKRSNAPGLRSGFVVGDPELVTDLKTIRNYGGAASPWPLMAAAAALWRDEAHVEENRAKYRLKFDQADKILNNKFEYYRPDGGFYLWLNVEDGETAANCLWTQAGIKVLPGKYLSKPDLHGASPGDEYIRVALVHNSDIVSEALKRIDQVL